VVVFVELCDVVVFVELCDVVVFVELCDVVVFVRFFAVRVALHFPSKQLPLMNTCPGGSGIVCLVGIHIVGAAIVAVKRSASVVILENMFDEKCLLCVDMCYFLNIKYKINFFII
jgi:hypothetical protein